MAKSKLQTAAVLRKETTVTRPGVHSKTKTSKSKGSKLYKKPYKGQGR